MLDKAPDLAVLFRLVGNKIEDRYHSFGVAVGLSESYLRGIELDCSNCQTKLINVFYSWSRSIPDTYTWRYVINVLESETIKAHETAQGIMEHLLKL